MILDKEKLIINGFLSFNLKDIDITLYNELYNNFNKKIAFNQIKRLRYDCGIANNNISGSIDEYFNNLKNKYVLDSDSSIHYTETSKNYSRINLNLCGSYTSLFKWKYELDNINGNAKSQSWFHSPNYSRVKIQNPIHNVYKQILSQLYFEYLNDDYYDNNLGFDLTLYEIGDFIEPHNDGIDTNKLCVILIYLNDDYQDGFGGELIIENNIIVPPIFGQVAILDFTNNNPNHSVNMVKNDNFKRFAFIRFFYKDNIK